ncbi:MAG: MmcQ/YjbR family DNA-binding protein [Candidatus Cybelea sp.]
MATWRDVQRIALALPGATEEATSSGNAAWLVSDRFFAWERPLRKSDLAALGDKAPSGAILGVRVADLELKEVLLASNPQVFFTTPHFDGYPAVLIRLPKIPAKLLKDVIVEAWLARAPKRAVTAYLKANSKA